MTLVHGPREMIKTAVYIKAVFKLTLLLHGKQRILTLTRSYLSQNMKLELLHPTMMAPVKYVHIPGRLLLSALYNHWHCVNFPELQNQRGSNVW